MATKRKIFSRRDFISKTASGVAFLGILNSGKNAFSSNRKKALKRSRKKKVIYRDLGKTGIKVPVVSMGVYTTSPELIKAAFKTGVRYFSTAHYYRNGLCEKTIGDGIKDLGVRDQVVIATKIHSGIRRNGSWIKNIKEQFLEELSLSMERLKTDYLDILYLYNVKNVDEIKKPEILEVLTQLKKQKKIRSCGFTTHSENRDDILNKAVEVNFFDLAIVSFNYSMFNNQALIKALENAAKNGMGLVAMKTQCGGSWSVDGYRNPKEQTKNQTALIKWVLRHHFISTVIPGVENFEHLNEDFSVAYDLGYTPEEKRFLNDENILHSIAFCQQCQRCIPSCPRGVNIPELMRTHMYAFQYRNLDLVHMMEKENKTRESMVQCFRCRECKAICFNSLNIPQKISELKKMNWA